MTSLKFSHITICAFLILIYVAVSAESKSCLPPVGLKTLTRIGKRLDSSSDADPSLIQSGSKRVKMTNFIRTGRTMRSCHDGDNQEWEQLHGNGIEPVYSKISNEMREPPYTFLNYDSPANWQFDYGDEEGATGWGAYHM